MLITPQDDNKTETGTEGCIAGRLIKTSLDEQADKFSVFHPLWESFWYMYTVGELGQLCYFPKLAEVVDGTVVLIRLAGQAQTMTVQCTFHNTLQDNLCSITFFFGWAKTEINITVKEAGVRLPVVGIFFPTMFCCSKLSCSTYIKDIFKCLKR